MKVLLHATTALWIPWVTWNFVHRLPVILIQLGVYMVGSVIYDNGSLG